MISRAPILIAATALLVWTLTACAPRPHPPERHISQRLIEETSEVFSRKEVVRWEDVFAWTFRDAEDLEPWRQQGFDLMAQRTDDHWRLGASRHGAFVERDTAFDSTDVDQLEVILGGTGRRPLELQWAAPGEPFAAQRSLQVRGEGEVGRYLFELALHPAWRGTIGHLRLIPRIPSKLRGRLLSVRGQRGVVAPARRQQASERPLKVVLAGTARTARLVLPGAPLAKTIDVDGPLQLQAAFGVDPEVRLGMVFRIFGIDAQGARHRLFETAVGTAVEGADEGASTDIADLPVGRWHRATVDLSPWQGTSLELLFETERLTGDGTVDQPIDAYGFWADLRLSRPLVDEPPPNVVLVVVDTLRADHLSLYGYPRPTSPNLDRWAAQRALTFRNVVAAAPWTYPSHLSLFTGLDALSHGQHHPRPLPPRFDLLAQKLQRAGYETLAVTGGGYLDTHYGFARGFDRYTVVPGHLGPKGDLQDGVTRALQWTAEVEHPYFLFLHTYEVHTPHRVRDPFYRQLSGQDGDPQRLARLTTRPLPTGDTAGAVRRKTYAWNDGEGDTEDLAPGDLQQVIDAYDSAIAYTDHQLDRLLTRLADDSASEMVIITSDHGEALGEHGLADHAYLYDFNLRIPLLISLPDGHGGGRWVDEQTRQIDVAPTVLDALGIDTPPVDGASLLPYFEDAGHRSSGGATEAWSATAYQGLSLRRGNRLKYILNPTLWQRQTARQALFLLDRDPDENNDLAPQLDATAELERLAIARFMENFDGLLISIDNPSTGAFQLTVEGPNWLGPQFFKSVDAPVQALGLDGAQRLRVEIAAEQRFSLVVEQVTPEDVLSLDLQGPDGSCALKLQSDPSGDGGLLQQRFDGTCQSLTEPQPGHLALTFLYRHPAPGTAAHQGDEVPPALAEQLRALGYLD